MSNLSELERFSWETATNNRLPGTEDWIEVAKLGDQGGYSWSDFNAYYSPAARRYFWHGDSGCSCNSWGDSLSSSEDLQNGSRANLLRAWEEFAKEHSYSIGVTGYIDGVSTIKTFKAPADV